MEVIEIVVLGHTLRAPRDEAEEFASKVAELEAHVASIPELLSQLDQVNRQHARVERELAAIRAAATTASGALTGSRRQQRRQQLRRARNDA